MKTSKTFDYLVDSLPFGYAYNFDNYLFNKVKHLNTQGVPDRADYFLINNVRKRIEAKIHFLLKDGIAYSPYKSLFGGFEFNPRIQSSLLMDFWAFIEADLTNRGIRSARITGFADCYAPHKASKIKMVMEKAGFSARFKAVNHHVTVEETPLEKKMHPMEARRLRKCVRVGFEFVEEPPENVNEIYNYLALCREEQSLLVSVTKAQLADYIRLFPQNYLMFSVRKQEEIVAATVVVKVHRQVLYNFLPGSLRTNKLFSPTVMLINGIYQYAAARGIEMLDLGISTLHDGIDQENLIQFKERMSGLPTSKVQYEKIF